MPAFFKKLLNFLFPQSVAARALEGMSAEDFMNVCQRSAEIETPNTFAVFNYKDPLVKEAVWQLKYRGNRKVARLLGEIMMSEIEGFLEESGVFENFRDPLLVPVPLSKERMRKRGFNQCWPICKEIIKGDAVKLAKDVLVKTRETPSQARAESREERLQNLRGCFAVTDPKKIAGRNIILIDDVITTGATVSEIRRALLAAGARKVAVFATAH